jgi:hypothetical protein
MRGRKPSGPECVAGLQGSARAKERLKVVLQTIAGQCTVAQACGQLQISEQRFRQLREQVLTGALERLEPRRAGRRPRKPTAEQAQLAALKQELEAAQLELRLASAREEIALTMPQVVQEPLAEEKKTRPRTPRGPRRRRGGRKRST